MDLRGLQPGGIGSGRSVAAKKKLLGFNTQ